MNEAQEQSELGIFSTYLKILATDVDKNEVFARLLALEKPLAKLLSRDSLGLWVLWRRIRLEPRPLRFRVAGGHDLGRSAAIKARYVPEYMLCPRICIRERCSGQMRLLLVAALQWASRTLSFP